MNLEDKVRKQLTQQKMSVVELAKSAKVKVSEIREVVRHLREEGYRVKSERHGKSRVYFMSDPNVEQEYFVISPASSRLKELKWLAFSDTHVGCRQFDEGALRHVLETGVKQGYRHAYFSGDLVDGNRVYHGQTANLSHWALEDQVSEAVRVLEDYDYDYYAIGGNHDYSWVKQGAPNPIDLVGKRMANFKVVGETKGDVVVEGMLMRLIHGAGGNAYAKSYPGQKYLRALFENREPDQDVEVGKKNYRLGVLQIGHYHTNMVFSAYGAQVIHPGAFQKPTEFTIRRGLEGPRGAYLVEAEVQNGVLKSFNPRWVKG